MKLSIFSLLIFISFEIIAQSTPYEIVQNMGRGINLGNTLSAPYEGNWAPIVHESYFEDVKNEGFSNVRIPVDFYGDRTSGSTASFSTASGSSSNYGGSISDFTVDTDYLNRLETVIDWSINQGLYTVLDFHGAELKSEFLYTFDIEAPEYCAPTSAKRSADLMKFKSIWTTIANRFINHSDHLIFEIVNEPYFELSDIEMDALNALIISTIRETGGNNTTRCIIITGGTQASYLAPTAISTAIIQSDDYLIASFHYYQPFDFTSSSSSNPNYDQFNWGTPADISSLISHFDIVKNWSETNNIPITLGEFGADNANGINYVTGIDGAYGGPVNADRVEFHRVVAEQAINRGFSFSVWCSGNKSNKTVHLRTDNPDTNNTIPGVWVTDVKDALLASGTWPVCYGPSLPAIILNPDFECGYSDQWSFSVFGAIAAANYSDAQAASNTGNVGGKVEVTTAHLYNKVLLSNNIYTEDLTGKVITIRGFVKALGEQQSIKIRVKYSIEGAVRYSVSEALELANGSVEGATYELKEFVYEVPDNAEYAQVQLMFGQFEGTYLIDSFSVSIEDATLGLDPFLADTQIKLFPNPSAHLINIYTSLNVKVVQIFNNLGQLVYNQNNISQIDISLYAKGIYLLKLETKKGNSYFKKLLIK
tara:strand:+ start:353 stop:2302 length:1950 start_codon:yes stop_codon:yes gene_type:complete